MKSNKCIYVTTDRSQSVKKTIGSCVSVPVFPKSEDQTTFNSKIIKMRIIISSLLLLSAHLVSAQNTPLAGVEYFNYLKAPVKDAGGNYETSFREFGAFGSFPVQSKNKKTVIVNGFQYASVDASVFNNVTSGINNRNFQSIAYNFSIIQNLNDKWKLALTLAPSLAGDFKDNLSSDDFFMEGALIAIIKLNSFSSLGGGVIYTNKLGNPSPLPALYFQYNKNRQKFNILLPTHAEYAYSIDAKDILNLGFRMSLNGANFHVSGNDVNSNVDVDKLSYSRINIGPVVSYRICKVVKLEMTGGISVARKFEFLDGEAKQYTLDSNNTGYFNVGLALIPPLGKHN